MFVQMFPAAVLLVTSWSCPQIFETAQNKRHAVGPSAILVPSPLRTRMCVACSPVFHSSPPCTYTSRGKGKEPKDPVSSVSHLIAGEGKKPEGISA
jgi:hypothetical protein